jgi:hypothetical protein
VASGLALADSLRAAYFQTRSLVLALDAGESTRIARGLAAQVGVVAVVGRIRRRSFDELVERARAPPNSPAMRTPLR